MRTKEIVCRSAKELNGLDLTIKASSTTITVGAGELRVFGKTHVLEEDEEFEVREQDVDVSLIGYVVQTADGVRLFVDEQSAIDPPFNFGQQSELKILCRLFVLNVPAGTIDLEDLEMVVYKIKPAEKAPEEETADA